MELGWQPIIQVFCIGPGVHCSVLGDPGDRVRAEESVETSYSTIPLRSLDSSQ